MPLDEQDVQKLRDEMTEIWIIRSQNQGDIMVIEQKLHDISVRNNDLLQRIININNMIKD